jgi:hypothetical protein
MFANGCKTNMTEKFKLFKVEWVDASRLSNGWMDLSDIPDPYNHKCVSVGFLVSSNKKSIVLVPTIADLEHPGNEHTYGGMMIPRLAILKKTRLG